MKINVSSFKGVGAISLASLVGAGVAFLVNVISARALGPEYRGEVAFVLQLSYVLAPIVGLGADRLILRASSSGGIKEGLGGSRTYSVSVAALLGGVLFLSFGPEAMLAAPAALVSAAFQIQRSRAIAAGSEARFLVLFALYQFSILAGTIVLAAVGAELWILWVMVYVIPGLSVVAVSFRETGQRRPRLLEALEAWPFTVAAISQMLVLRSERLLLPALAGPSSLGVYVVVATATEPLLWIAQALADTRASRERRVLRWRAVLAGLFRDALTFGIVAALGGVALYHLIEPVFGIQYADGKELVVPLCLAGVALVSYRQSAGIALGHLSKRALGVVETAVALIAFTIYASAISRYAIIGAAWASVFVYLFACIVLLLSVRFFGVRDEGLDK